MDKSRLTSIYAKCSALIAHLVSFGGISWAKIIDNTYSAVVLELDSRFITFEHSLASLIKCVNKLAKRLNTPGPMVSQPSFGH
ncbi:hypothetical protein G9A89_009448 [Geosiphon pyriformis]|nr:hypothetical protein G9A89_009448 [Geosiphon pyriformis]